jgi:hypothetical protein
MKLLKLVLIVLLQLSVSVDLSYGAPAPFKLKGPVIVASYSCHPIMEPDVTGTLTVYSDGSFSYSCSSIQPIGGVYAVETDTLHGQFGPGGWDGYFSQSDNQTPPPNITDSGYINGQWFIDDDDGTLYIIPGDQNLPFTLICTPKK